MIRNLLIALLLVGCNVDSDLDGLTNREEAKLGTDATKVDSDGDGLSDWDEVYEYNTDPVTFDSDRDQYGDGDEIHFGSDPLDYTSVIYKGGWPYNRLDSPQGEIGSGIGSLFPGDLLRDQYGDVVNMYHFVNADKPIVMDISAAWCGPCRLVSAWLSGVYEEEAAFLDDYAPNTRRLVEEGEVYWITILVQDVDGSLPRRAIVKDWHEVYPNEYIPVLADKSGYVFGEISDSMEYFPSFYVLNPDMTIATPTTNAGTLNVSLGIVDASIVHLTD